MVAGLPWVMFRLPFLLFYLFTFLLFPVGAVAMSSKAISPIIMTITVALLAILHHP